MGIIRDLGLKHEAERFSSISPHSGIVSILGADTRVDSTYVRKILNHFADPKNDALFVDMDYYIPSGSEKLFSSSFINQFRKAYYLWQYAVESRFGGFISGVQITARVKTIERINGIPRQASNEDFALAQYLMDEVAVKYVTDVTVHTSDRAREEGFDSKIRLRQLDETVSKRDISKYRPRASFLQNELVNAYHEDNSFIYDSKKMAVLFVSHRIPYKHQQFLDHLEWAQKLEAQLPNKDKSMQKILQKYTGSFIAQMAGWQDTQELEGDSLWSKDFVTEAYEVFKRNISEDETQKLDEIIASHKKGASIILNVSRSYITEAVAMVYSGQIFDEAYFNKKPKAQEFIEQNPWIIGAANELPSKYPDQKSALDYLLQTYPEYMGDFDHSGLRKATVILQALTEFAIRAGNEPEQFPLANAFLKRIQL